MVITASLALGMARLNLDLARSQRNDPHYSEDEQQRLEKYIESLEQQVEFWEVRVRTDSHRLGGKS